MDMDTLREGLHVSISQVKMYLRCPRQFFFRYVDGAQAEGTSASLLFGKAFHASLAALYLAIKDTQALPDLGTLVEVFTDTWETQKARTVMEEEGKLGNPVTKAGNLLRVWLGMMKLRALPQVVEVEKAFSVPLMDHVTGQPLEERLVGAFDLVIVENGRPVVVEHKTASRRYGGDVLLNDLQMTGYVTVQGVG